MAAGGRAADGGELLDDLRDVGRLVALAAIRNRRQVGAVGLDQQPIGRRGGGGLAQRFGLREGHDAGNRQEEAGRQRAIGGGLIAGEAVEDAAQPALPFLAE